MKFQVLAVNPGSTSTKIAVYKDTEEVFVSILRHSFEDLAPYKKVVDQYGFRKELILKALSKNKIEHLDAVVGRGGLLRPVPGGTYAVNDLMIADLKKAQRGEHASNLGAILAKEIGGQFKAPSFIVDPVVVDEMQDIARISGIPEIKRRPVFHALNQRAIARRAALKLGKEYDKLNLIVAHLGGGISVGAHKKGQIIDVNNALDGEGPFSPERSGSVPATELLSLSYKKGNTKEVMSKKITGKGGLVAYLGTNSTIEVNQMIDQGNKQAETVYKAMAYQVAKEIGALSTVLKGKVDAILITGGVAYDERFISWIKKRIEFIAKVLVFPGEDELLALCEGALRVLRQEEEAKEY